MAASDAKPFWKDDEIAVDRDGIPRFTGAKPELMKEYRRRVLFAYNNLEGSGDDEAKEARSLKKKKARFAKRLLDALHGEAWRSYQDLLLDAEGLRKEDGYKKVFAALQSIEKVGVIKKTEAFDHFFERCYRRRGQSIDQFLRTRSEGWSDLRDLAEGINMSEDLLAYFLLKSANLSREERRQILLANQSDYSLAGIEKALRVSFFDLHEKEKGRDWSSTATRKPAKGFGKRSYTWPRTARLASRMVARRTRAKPMTRSTLWRPRPSSASRRSSRTLARRTTTRSTKPMSPTRTRERS